MSAMNELHIIPDRIDEVILGSDYDDGQHRLVLQQLLVAGEITLGLFNVRMGQMDIMVKLTPNAYFKLKRHSHWIYGEMLELELSAAICAVLGPIDDADPIILQANTDCIEVLKAEWAAYKAENADYLRRAQQPPPNLADVDVESIHCRLETRVWFCMQICIYAYV